MYETFFWVFKTVRNEDNCKLLKKEQRKSCEKNCKKKLENKYLQEKLEMGNIEENEEVVHSANVI